MSNVSFHAAAVSSLKQSAANVGGTTPLQAPSFSMPNMSLTPPPLSVPMTSTASVPMVASRSAPSSQVFGGLVVPNGSALQPKLQVVLSVFDLLSKNSAFASLARSTFDTHKCCAACPVCTLVDVQKLSAPGHRDAARIRLDDMAAELQGVSMAEGAAYCLQYALVGMARAYMGTAPSSAMFSYEKLVNRKSVATDLPSSLFLHVDVPLTGLELYKLGALGLSCGASRYEVKAAVMRVMLPSGAWHFYTVELREGVWRTSRANYAVLLIGEAQLLLAERVDVVSPQASALSSVPSHPMRSPSPAFSLASSHTHSSNDAVQTVVPDVASQCSPPPVLTVNGHEVELKGIGEQGFTVELEWEVEHQKTHSVQPTSSLEALADKAEVDGQVEEVLRQLGLCGDEPWIRMTSAHASSEFLAMLKGWTVVQRDGEMTTPAADGEVVQMINLSSSRRARSQGKMPEAGTMALRFTLLPSRGGAAAPSMATMTCLYRRGNLERPFGSQPIVEVDAMALFGRLPVAPLDLPVSSSEADAESWVVVKGVNSEVESVLVEKLGFSWVESLKSKPLRKKGCRHGMRTVRMASAGQVEFLTVHLGHLFIGTGPCGRKQSRFLKFERDRRLAARKH